MKFDYQRKKTFTKYWNNFSTKPKANYNINSFFKKIKDYIFKLLGFKISIKILRYKNKNDDAFVSYQTDFEIKEYRNKLIQEQILKFLHSSKIVVKPQELNNYIQEFNKVFFKSPIRELESGFGFNEGVFLYTILKIIKPTLVIESGIMKGFTTYLIDAATNNDCKILCHDINLDNNLFISKKAKYINSDILDNNPCIKNERVFALWDDHTSQLDRLQFSIKNKIKYNFFDDDLSFLNLHSDGWPPIPSITMMKEIKKSIINKNNFEWISRNRKGLILLEKLVNDNTIDQIDFHKTLPELFSITGYRNHSQCSLVINK
jgi:hypothetical protein